MFRCDDGGSPRKFPPLPGGRDRGKGAGCRLPEQTRVPCRPRRPHMPVSACGPSDLPFAQVSASAEGLGQRLPSGEVTSGMHEVYAGLIDTFEVVASGGLGEPPQLIPLANHFPQPIALTSF